MSENAICRAWLLGRFEDTTCNGDLVAETSEQNHIVQSLEIWKARRRKGQGQPYGSQTPIRVSLERVPIGILVSDVRAIASAHIAAALYDNMVMEGEVKALIAPSSFDKPQSPTLLTCITIQQ